MNTEENHFFKLSSEIKWSRHVRVSCMASWAYPFKICSLDCSITNFIIQFKSCQQLDSRAFHNTTTWALFLSPPRRSPFFILHFYHFHWSLLLPLLSSPFILSINWITPFTIHDSLELARPVGGSSVNSDTCCEFLSLALCHLTVRVFRHTILPFKLKPVREICSLHTDTQSFKR